MERKPIPRRFISFGLAQAWAMQPAWVQQLHMIAQREGVPTSVAATSGEPFATNASVRNGVAILPVCGPIMRYANLFSDVSGATSIEVLATDLREAIDDPSVRAILLDINSPGGTVEGVNECAEMIYAARSRKKITAYIGGTGASAAYWLAAAAPRVVVDATAVVGSIGVVMAMPKPNSKDGIEIVSSNAPNKRPNLASKEGRAVIQANVDALEDVFVASVAKYRGVSIARVLADFGAGDVRVGLQAVKAGMVDELGSFESVLASLGASSGTRTKRSTANYQQTPQARRAEALDSELPTVRTLDVEQAVDSDESPSTPAFPKWDTMTDEQRTALAVSDSMAAHQLAAESAAARAAALRGDLSGWPRSPSSSAPKWDAMTNAERHALIKKNPAAYRASLDAIEGDRLSALMRKSYAQLTADGDWMGMHRLAAEHPDHWARIKVEAGETSTRDRACSNCKAKAPSDTRFCTKCGTPLEDDSKTDGTADASHVEHNAAPPSKASARSWASMSERERDALAAKHPMRAHELVEADRRAKGAA